MQDDILLLLHDALHLFIKILNSLVFIILFIFSYPHAPAPLLLADSKGSPQLDSPAKRPKLGRVQESIWQSEPSHS